MIIVYYYTLFVFETDCVA